MSDRGKTGGDDRRRSSPQDGHLSVLLVSPLPPPEGGVSTWTSTIVHKGLPDGGRLTVVDTRMEQRAVGQAASVSLREVRRSVRIFARLLKELVFGDHSIVHVNCSLSPTGVFRDWATVRISRAFRLPVVVNLRGNFIEPRAGSFVERIVRRAYKDMFNSAALIVPLNRDSLRAVNELGEFAGKTEIIPNFIDTALILPAKRQRSPSSPPLAVFIGPLMEAKGLRTLVRLAERLPAWRFELIGIEPTGRQHAIQAMFDEAGASDRVELVGTLPHQKVLERLRNADAYVFPSHTEGFPISVAEAMATGLPVVASPVGAIPDMIDEGQGGFLVAHEDIEGYVEALARLRSDSALALSMGAHNRKRALGEYEFDVVILRWAELYRRNARP